MSTTTKIGDDCKSRQAGKDIYDVEAYAKFSAHSYSYKYLEKPTLVSIINKSLDRETKIIEAGCGDGRVIELLTGLGVKEKNITGIDLSNYLLDLGRKKFPEINWICGSIGEEIREIREISKQWADWVICSMVLDYLDNSSFSGFLNNSFNWLKVGGNLVFIIPHPVRMVENLSKYYDRKKSTNLTPWGEEVPYNHRTVSDYINGVIEAGFEVIKVIEPELSVEAKKEDPAAFVKYSSYPMRLAIWAIKK